MEIADAILEVDFGDMKERRLKWVGIRGFTTSSTFVLLASNARLKCNMWFLQRKDPLDPEYKCEFGKTSCHLWIVDPIKYKSYLLICVFYSILHYVAYYNFFFFFKSNQWKKKKIQIYHLWHTAMIEHKVKYCALNRTQDFWSWISYL